MASRPLVSVHYPRSMGEFQSWFATDADCLDYLAWLRWPGGFACPTCGHPAGWSLADGRIMCKACSSRVSPTSGTIFDRTRTPLTVWFMVCWLFATQKDGTSALTLQKNLEIGSYQTAWALLHRLRSVLVRPGRERLVGAVEVDETYVGGNELGVHLGRAKGKKSMVGIAVERIGARASGRCRMALLRDASAESLRAFLRDHVEEGSTVVSDGWRPYQGATAGLYVHRPLVGHGPAGSKLLPRVHRVAGLAKRWMLSTHQGSIGTDHLASYLNEFVFRFNRRRSRSRGLVFFRVLELAVLHEPVRYRDLIAHAKPGVAPPPPPRTYRQPASLERPRADRPWRAAPPIHSG